MAESENSVRRYRLSYGLIILALFFFRLWFSGSLPLSGDETYHWEWSRHLALGYYDHPGLTAYLIKGCTLLFGSSTEISVRFAALLMLTLTSIVAYLLGRAVVINKKGTEIQAERAGFMSGILISIIPIYAAFSIYISTDPPLIFFWTLSVYLFYRALNTGTYPAWILAGASVGFALMSKFLAFFIMPAVFLFMLISPDDRKWFGRWQLYAAGGACLLVVSPFVIWNMQNGWPTFMFNFIYRQAQTGLHPLSALEYVGAQSLAISPIIFVCVLAGIWVGLRKWSSSRDRSALFLALTSAVPLLYFLYVGFRRQVGLHWPTAGWVGGIVLWACYASLDWSGNKVGRRMEKLAVWSCLIITITLHLMIHIPQRWITSGWKYSGSPERINLEKSAARYGWKELGQKVLDLKNEMVSVQNSGKGVFVISDQYGLSSSIAFYAPDQMETHLWVTRKIHGENYRFWDDYPSMKEMDAIFVTKSKNNADNVRNWLRKYFEKVEKPECFPVVHDGNVVRKFYLIRCFVFNGVAPDFQK